MKKVIIILVCFFIFLFGLTLGGSFNSSSSKLFEESLDKFEEQIKDPLNEYESKALVPESNIINKTAKKCESFIDDLIDKLFSFLS